jgi:hypothetical protein
MLGIAGGFVLNTLHGNRPFALLMAPICGMLILPPLVTLFYSTGKISFSISAILAIATASVATLLTSLRGRWTPQNISTSLLLLVIVCAVVAGISNASTIHNGELTFLFTDGTDHAGYAHLADWLLNFSAQQTPVATPSDIYQSWPEYMYRADPRLSAFVMLALVALLRGTSGIFAYDLACGLVLAASILGVAAVFAKSRLTLILLICVLALSVWFEYGRAGFFSKLVAYPGVLFLIGVLITTRGWDGKSASALAVLVVGVATMHSAMATILFLIAVGAPFIAAQAIVQRQFGACSFAQICDLATEEILFIEQASVTKQFGAGQEHGPGYVIDRAQRIVS